MDRIVEWARELQSLAQAGLFYGHDDFDKERYQRIREISAEMMAERTGLPVDKVRDLFCNETGYQTPKLDTRAAVIREGRVIACDTVEHLAKSNARRITLRGSRSREALADIRDWKQENDTVSFLYSGDINHLVQVLSTVDVQDLTVAEPDLEEIILHYYGKGEENE